MNKKIKYLILDAMGVIYKTGDDLSDILIPFIKSKNSQVSNQNIIDNYTQASLGQISSEEFWRNMDLSDNLEDEYLSNFALTDGLFDFLEEVSKYFEEIICLSNDVSEWSKKLRIKFGLTKYIKKWFISGDMHCGKPFPIIYKKLLSSLENKNPDEFIFIDDKVENLTVAEKIGFNVILYGTSNKDILYNINSLDSESLEKLVSLI